LRTRAPLQARAAAAAAAYLLECGTRAHALNGAACATCLAHIAHASSSARGSAASRATNTHAETVCYGASVCVCARPLARCALVSGSHMQHYVAQSWARSAPWRVGRAAARAAQRGVRAAARCGPYQRAASAKNSGAFWSETANLARLGLCRAGGAWTELLRLSRCF
jgi:hypothetical protein